MGGWRSGEQTWRGLLAAVLLGLPALAVGAPVSEEGALPGGAPGEGEGAGGALAGETPDAEASRPEGDVLEGALAEASPGLEAQVPPPGPMTSGEAVAPPTAEVPAAAVPAATPAGQGKKKKKKAKPGEGVETSLGEDPDALDDAGDDAQRVRVFGRVYARARADERVNYARNLSLPSARVGVGTSLPNIEAEVSADLADNNILKDAFVRLADDSKRFRVYGGRFKTPFLERVQESSWRLPLQSRGLVEDYLTSTNDLGGRRLGLMGEVRLKQFWDARLSAGLFEGSKDETGVRLSEDASARLSFKPIKKRLTLGVSTYVAEALKVSRRHAVAADATLDIGPLAVSGEAVTGRLPVGPFNAQLLLAYWTVRLGRSEWALQPLVGAEALQLRGETKGEGHSLVGGLNVLLADHFKAQFQVERALRPGDAAPALEYSLQLATRFF